MGEVNRNINPRTTTGYADQRSEERKKFGNPRDIGFFKEDSTHQIRHQRG
jgi:hypothetical protein